MDTASDASVQSQVPARRGRRLRILGTQPTVEDFRPTTRFSPLKDVSDLDIVSEVWEGTTSETESLARPKQLEGRMQRFSEGRWVELVAESEEVFGIARTAAVRKRRRGSDQDRKVARAESLVLVSELVVFGQASVGEH